jgi:uncharacterized protein YjbI with pentapeptide repeats
VANVEHLRILERGVDVWNKWRKDNPSIQPNLEGANLNHAELEGVDFSHANLLPELAHGVFLGATSCVGANPSGADFRDAKANWADFRMASLRGADLRKAHIRYARLRGVNFRGAKFNETHLDEADLMEANFNGVDLLGVDSLGVVFNGVELHGTDFYRANLSGADFCNANLSEAYLFSANLSRANLSGAVLNRTDLRHTVLYETDFAGAELLDCMVHGASVWDAKLATTKQSNLIISKEHGPLISADSLEVAQFIYILLQNEKIRTVIDAITTKTVLILGRFTQERKAVLDAIRDELRRRDYVPILFDFDQPQHRDLTETISTLAHMARFIIADITDAKSIPQELQAIVPHLPSVAVQPIINAGSYEYALFEHFERYNSVLPVYQYEEQGQLIVSLSERVIKPAEAKVEEMRPRPR